MLPTYNAYGNWPASGEIDIMESRGNGADCSLGGHDTFGSTLHWGPNWDQDRYDLTHADYKHTSSLADEMHIYGLLWTPERLQTYIDSPSNIVLDVNMSDKDFFTKGGWANQDNPWVNESTNAPFNQDFYLILNVAVGGTGGYFPDGSCNKPWTNSDAHASNTFYNSKDSWYPGWNYPASH